MVAIEFGSNLDARDLLDLFAEDQPPPVFASLSAFHLDMSKARRGQGPELPDGTPDPDYPNTFEALEAVDAFAKLKAWECPLILEAACLKGWDCHGEVLRDQMREGIATVRSVGGDVKAVAFDEPLTASLQTDMPCGLEFWTTVQIVGNAIHELQDLRVEAQLLEAYPFLDSEQILKFVDALALNGTPIRQFIWDLDTNPNAYGKQSFWDKLLGRPHGLTDPLVQADLREATAELLADGVAVGVVIIGGPQHTQRQYRVSTLRFSRALRDIWEPDDIAALVVKNWHPQPGVADGEGPRFMPDNLPVQDPTSHLGILQTVRQEWAA